jgi:D-alanyl-D-alanine carboxypeptidase
MTRRPNFEDLVSNYKNEGQKPWNGLKVMVVDPKTGEVLVNAGGELPHDPASLTKLMTFYIAQRAIQQKLVLPDTMIVINKRVDYAKVEPGDKLTLDLALKAMMTASDNGVSQAIADIIEPTLERNFIKHANTLTKRLGMVSTHFSNPHGLPARPKNITTAHDMARLMQQIHTEFPDNMADYMGINSVRYDDATYFAHHDLNRSVAPGGLPENMEASAKTGYTNRAGHNIAALVTNEESGKQVIVVVLGGRWTTRSARIAMDLPVGHAGDAQGSQVRDALVSRLAEHYLDNEAHVSRAEQPVIAPPVVVEPKKLPTPPVRRSTEAVMGVLANDDENTWPHTVKDGENLAIIAARYGVAVADIVASNKQLANPSHLLVGKKIQIPHVASYPVQAGDTLSEIAERFVTTPDILRQMNGMARNTVVTGRRIAVPAVVGVVAENSNIFDAAKTVVKDSCDAVDYAALRKLVYSMNDKDNDVVHPGQALFFPRHYPCKSSEL